MKKVLALVLALVFVVSAFSTFVIAADETQSGDITIDVGTGVTHTYSADITFNPGDFLYNSKSVWDDENYKYIPDPSGDGAWIIQSEGKVTVTNHSDCPLEYVVAISNVTNEYGDLEILFDETNASADITGTIAAVAVGATQGVTEELASWYVSGTPSVSEIQDEVLGTVTVTLTMVTP